MSIKFKNFILNGITYGVIFFLLSLILSHYILNLSFRNAAIQSLSIGLLALVVNGLIQSRFTKSIKKLNAIAISLSASEQVQLAGPANHMIEDHLHSGKLFLTSERLVFKSFEEKEFSWPVSDFSLFRFHPSIFNLGGEFIIGTVSQDELVFEVDEIRVWKKALMHLNKK